MKQFILVVKTSFMVLIVWAFFPACGGSNAEQKAEQEKLEAEVRELDSLSTELETAAEEIKVQTHSLQEALDALDTGQKSEQ